MHVYEKFSTAELKRWLEETLTKNDKIMEMDGDTVKNIENEWQNQMCIYLYNQISVDTIRCIIRSREGGNPFTDDEMLMLQLREYDLFRQLCEEDSLLYHLLCKNVEDLEYYAKCPSLPLHVSNEIT